MVVRLTAFSEKKMFFFEKKLYAVGFLRKNKDFRGKKIPLQRADIAEQSKRKNHILTFLFK